MTVSAVELLHGLKLGSSFYSQIENADPTFNDDQFPVIASGDTMPRFISLNGSKEEVPFATHQLATALAQFTTSTLCSASGTNGDVFFRKLSHQGTRVAAASTVHTRFRAASWFAYLMSISAGNRQQAVARGRMACLYDGTNSPLVRSSVAITDTPTTAESFVLGPIAHNGTKITGCDNLSIDFQPQLIELHDQSEQGTTFIAINTFSPTITFTTSEMGIESLRGSAITNSVKINLFRRKPDDRLYATGDAQHIVFAVTTGMFFVQSLAGSPTQKQVTLVCRATDAQGFSPSALSITVNTAQDVSA